MRQRFTVIEGGAAALGTVPETVTEVNPHSWRIDLHKVAGVEAEHIAAWIWARTKAALPALSSVKVYETPMSWAEYEGEAAR